MAPEDQSQAAALARLHERSRDVWRWPSRCVLSFPDLGYDLVELFREVHAALAPGEPGLSASAVELPQSGHGGRAHVSARGDGIVQEHDWVTIVGADHWASCHLIVGDEVSIEVRSTYGDLWRAEDPKEPHSFHLRARTSEALERAAAVLVERLAARGALLSRRHDP